MSETIGTYEKLKGKSVQCLLQEHPCMAYEEELMMAAAVLSGVKIIKIVKRDKGPTTINDMLKSGVVRSHMESSEEHKANQSKALAAFIAVFEEQAEMHRRYEELFNENRSEHPQTAHGQQLAAV